MLGKAQYSQLKKCQRFQPVQYRLHWYYKTTQILWKLIAFFQECQKLSFLKVIKQTFARKVLETDFSNHGTLFHLL